MKLVIQSPGKSLSKAYLRQSVRRDDMESFTCALSRLFERVRSDESEEHLKNIVADFLKDAFYRQTFEINTSGRADLVIHNGRASTDPIAVLVEVKRPANAGEMISAGKPNAKAMHELLHYYLQERYLRGNTELKRLIVCNVFEWYIFDAVDFERFFFANRKLVKSYKEWSEGLLVSSNTDWFYQEIARPFIESESGELPCVYFDLRDYVTIPALSDDPSLARRGNTGKDAASPPSLIRRGLGGGENNLIHLYKLLAPEHLLKLPVANDSNSLNREFYAELLHIIGLEEVKEKGKKLIQRKAAGRRDDGSLLENTINILKIRNKINTLPEGESRDEDKDSQFFNIALELCITWLNRLLFLKLLEGQLIAYHKGDRSYSFLNSTRIADFDELNELFFEVLALRVDERSGAVHAKFGTIPYLNSSLFEESDLERSAIRINELKNRLDLPLHGATVLKGGNGKRLAGSKNSLSYLFEFLDAYDFAAEGTAEIREQNRSIINASVLGLIFEKINGYRDGSFFTPGFITMYICRETIRRAVLKKFNDRFGWSCADFTALYNSLDRVSIKEANEVVNSLTICDPAVGSGHFLVSALNEILAIKSDLGILADADGKRLRGYGVTVENDELIITVDDQLFEYNYKDPESQRVQETLFFEKATVIENCLFGVDINPKSVSICRLRLWIELLKNAYYRRPSPPALSGTPSLITEVGEVKSTPPVLGGARGGKVLETLPNIDINIKCGNSLVSRFAIYGNPNIQPGDRKKLKELTERYRRYVFEYKLSPANKGKLRKVISALKHDLESFGLPSDRDLIALRRKENEIDQLGFDFDKKGAESRQKLMLDVATLKERFAEKERLVYSNAFEWRFEFPEVLDEAGEFAGFDAIIGNPPYIRQEAIKGQKPVFQEMFGDFYCGTADIYTYFYKAGLGLLNSGGLLCYIAPNKFMRAGYGKNTRELLTSHATPLLVMDFGDLPIFDEATTYPSIVMVEKTTPALSGDPSLARRGNTGKDAASPPSLIRRGLGGGDFLAATFTGSEQLKQFDETLSSIGFTMPVSALSIDGWTLERPEVLALMDKLRKAGKPLGEYVERKFYYGIKTGLNEAFVIDEATRARLIAEDPKSAEIIKPWLRGRDIKKWRAEWAGLYLICIASSANREWPWSKAASETEALLIFRKSFPAVCAHLEAFAVPLRKRDDQGRFWWELRSCVYYEEFLRPKIMYAEISTEGRFFLESEGYFSDTTTYIMANDSKWLLAVLNSRLFTYLFSITSSEISGGFLRWKRQYMENIPIPASTDAQKKPIIELVEQILAVKRPPLTPPEPGGGQTAPLLDKEGQGVVDIPALEAEIDRLVYALYGLTEEEIAIVEGKR